MSSSWFFLIHLIAMLAAPAAAQTEASPVPTTTPALAKAVITETDISLIQIQDITLGMSKAQVEAMLLQTFSNAKKADATAVAAYQCIKKQCQAQRSAADGSATLNIHFNRHDKVYWIALGTQTQLAASIEECLRLGAEQLAALRQQYAPEDQQHFYGQNSLTLRLNKQGHPDPADNSFFGFRVQIRCDAFAKGLANREFELRDNAL